MAADNQHPMLKADPRLRDIVRRLAEAYDPERIYLFGSRARGDFRPESDYDLLVIVPDDAPPERRQDRLAASALRGLRVATSVLVDSSSYFEARRHLKASLPGTVLREGKLLYGREHNSTRADSAVAKSEDTKEWLRKAETDLRGADQLFSASPPLLDLTLFHCQQAGEKALKAFLAWHDVQFKRTHDIDELGQACLALDASLADLIARASSLTDCAWKFRYPGAGPLPSSEQTKEIIEIGRQLFQAVLARLPAECKP
jgi:predicted nucleotidyltransferase/HEPN domain-containing protein